TAIPAPALSDDALKHFQQSISYQTVSYGDVSLWDSLPFIAFRKFLETTYPLVHQQLEREIISNYSYLYKWQGYDTTLNPFILMAHQDVVPIEESTKTQWNFEPFSGIIKDGYVCGRGTTDDKINLISILESTEKLLKENFKPARTIYFVFGHDEELGGKNGAKKIAELLESRKVKAELVMDEGGFVTNEKVPGVTKPVALVGTSEKGYLSIEFSVNKMGGHSSMPESETAIDILTKAIVKLRSKPFEAKFVESTKNLFEFLGPEMKFPNNMAFANPIIFKSIIVKNYEKSGSGNAMIRTTFVPTIIHAGIKDNVVPTLATAVVNFRLLPGDSSKHIFQKVKTIINDDRVVMKNLSLDSPEATPVSSATSAAFKTIDSIIKKSYSGVLTTPFLMIGGTDSKHFHGVSENIFKFSPMKDPIGFHTIDEQVSIESYRHSLWFFEQLMRSCR
ncbi:MAG TPA: M20/M25/M40 family metallo-hydrolase, partial [Chitinophagales bacterium]|nr:M20/M25/M40 family metallo-hydrolase [Chitinophagales bacterium]